MKSTGLIFAERPYTGGVTPTTYEDMSRFGNTCTINGATPIRLPSGIWVWYYNGSNQEIAITIALTIPNPDGSFAIWHKFDATGSSEDILGLGSTSASRYLRKISNEGLDGETKTNGQYFSVSTDWTIPDSTVWRLSVFTMGAVVTYYDNAVVRKNTNTPTGDLSFNRIGNDNDTYPMTGATWGFRAWNYTLSAGRVAAIFQAERHWFGV